MVLYGGAHRERENDPFSRLHGDQRKKKDRAPDRARRRHLRYGGCFGDTDRRPSGLPAAAAERRRHGGHVGHNTSEQVVLRPVGAARLHGGRRGRLHLLLLGRGRGRRRRGQHLVHRLREQFVRVLPLVAWPLQLVGGRRRQRLALSSGRLFLRLLAPAAT